VPACGVADCGLPDVDARHAVGCVICGGVWVLVGGFIRVMGSRVMIGNAQTQSYYVGR
jgi:hypothetical protein